MNKKMYTLFCHIALQFYTCDFELTKQQINVLYSRFQFVLFASIATSLRTSSI